jgi:hypothetical protein
MMRNEQDPIMKASLASATSIAALFAFEAGPASGAPVFDLSVSSALSSCSNVSGSTNCMLTFYALPGQAASTQTVTMKADVAITGAQQFDAAPAGFSGAVSSRNSSLAQNSTFTSNSYGFTGAASAGATGQSQTASGTVHASVQKGTALKSPNAAQTSNLTFKGVTVAPVLGSVTGADAGSVLVKDDSASVAVTVTNVGAGNLSGKGNASNLNGTLGVGSGMFSGGPSSISIADSSNATATYVFAPTQIGVASSTISASFSDGSSDGKNQSASATATISGTGVAPIQSVSSTPGPLYVLVGSSAAATVTVTNTGNGNKDAKVAKSISNLNGSIGAGDSVFVGGGGKLSGPETGLRDGASQTATYVFTPTVRSGGQLSTDIVTTFSNGSVDGKNLGSSVISTLTGQGVAPVNQVSSVSPVFVRAGGASASTTVTIANIGNGNLATGGPSALSNLNGTAGAIGGTNWSGAGGGFSIQDNSVSAGPTSKTYSYQYAPQARGTSATGSVAIGFTNGSSDQTNGSQTVNVSLVGNTVGPVFQSKWPADPGGTINTSGKNGTAPTGTVNWGTVSKLGSYTELLQIANVTTDDNGGMGGLTDLSIESFTIAGKNAANFNIDGSQSGIGTQGKGVVDVIHEGDQEFVAINFDAKGVGGSFKGILTLFTDEGAALGGVGNFYMYNLAALTPVGTPEPASLLLLSIGIGGVLIVRRRKSH